MNIIFANISGFIALIISIYMYQAKNKRNLLLRQVIYTFFILIEFFLLNAYIALFVSLISFFRSLIFYYYNKKGIILSKWYIYFIMFLFLLTILFTYKNVLSLIPIFIGITYTLSLQLKNVRRIKIICLVLSFLWIIYYLFINAYISIITRVIDIIAIIYSLIKKDFKNL